MPLLRITELHMRNIASSRTLALFFVGISCFLLGIAALIFRSSIEQAHLGASLGWLPLLFLGGMVVILLWVLPKLQVARSKGLSDENRFDRENEARKTLAQILGGAFVLAGLYSSIESFDLARDGQITDRFTKAVEQLSAVDDRGREKIAIRVGGIYALERIARDSDRDRGVVMAVLTTYVRENSPRKESGQINEETPPRGKALSAPQAILGADIQAVLAVLRRRKNLDVMELSEPLSLTNTYLRGADFSQVRLPFVDLSGADLSGAVFGILANLRGAKLVGANLSGAELGMTDLSDANLSRADLRRTNLSGAKLVGANLVEADLTTANLNGADLSGANLSGAKFGGAKFWLAKFIDADLSGADLSGALLLRQYQIDSSRGDARTLLPENLRASNSWNH